MAKIIFKTCLEMPCPLTTGQRIVNYITSHTFCKGVSGENKNFVDFDRFFSGFRCDWGGIVPALYKVYKVKWKSQKKYATISVIMPYKREFLPESGDFFFSNGLNWGIICLCNL